MHAGLCRGRPDTSLTTRRTTMKINQLNKTLCEEIFGGELNATEESEVEKP